ncbi:unnamed protein product [Lathyrus oleraceus]
MMMMNHPPILKRVRLKI